MAQPHAVRDRVSPYDRAERDPNEIESRLARRIERRRSELQDGTVKAIPAAEVRERLAAWHPKA